MPVAPVVTLKSLNGHLELYPEQLVFRKEGLLARFVSLLPEKVVVVKLADVTTVQILQPQALLNGLLIIDFKTKEKDGRIFMVYKANQQKQVQKIRETIEDYLSRREVYPMAGDKHLNKAI